MPRTRWPSLADQYALAQLVYGDGGHRVVDDWLSEQTARVDDPEFAAEFREVRLPGITPGEFAHRLVGSSRGALLGGIRFRGRDIGRPFVEVVAHDFEELDDLRDCVQSEWAAFAPGALRLHAAPGRLIGGPVVTDLTRRYAASAQTRWAHLFGARDRLLLGTIDRLNAASRRTALRAGRPAVLEAVFVALEHSRVRRRSP